MCTCPCPCPCACLCRVRARARVCMCVCMCVFVCCVRACIVRARKIPTAVEGREREREREKGRRRAVAKGESLRTREKFPTTSSFLSPFFLFPFYNHGDSDDDAGNNDEDDDVERRKSCDSTSSFGFISLSRHIASSPFSKAKGTAYGCFRK